MKVFFAVALLLTSQAFAGYNPEEVFSRGVVPRDLQVRVLDTLLQKCNSPNGALFWLEEIDSQARPVKVDQNVMDWHYTITFKGYYLFDGTHPVGTQFTVQAAECAILNPAVDRLEVSAISTDGLYVCRLDK